MKKIKFQKNVVIFMCIAATQIHTMHFSPDSYSENNEPQAFWAEKMIEKISSSDTELAILDIGCGDGKITVNLLNKFPHITIVATDLNPNMITFAQNKYQKQTNINWQVSDVKDIANVENFDIVVSFSALHWIDDIKEALTNIHHALKKNGHLYAVLAAKKSNNTFDVAVDRSLKNIKYLPYIKKNMSQLDLVVHEYDAVEFEELLKKAGFAKCSCNTEEMRYNFENKTKFINWITASSPFYAVLGDLHTSFIEDVATTYIDLTDQKANDSVTYTDYLLYVIAQK